MADPVFPDDLGVSPPEPMPMATPGVQSFLPQPNMAQKIAPAAVAALALMLGPKRGGGGLAAGFAQGQQRQNQNDLQRAQILQQDAIRQQQLQQQQMAIDQRREQQRMAAVQSVRQALKGVKDKAQYDELIEGYAATFTANGMRMPPNELRVQVPFVAASAKEIAASAVDAWLKNPANQNAMKADPNLVSRVVLRIDTNGDNIPENVPLLRAGEIGGIQFATDENGKALAVEGDEPVGDKFRELYKAKLALFVAENKRQPEPKEKETLIKAAVRESAEEARKPDVGGGLNPKQKFDATRSLQNDWRKVAQPLREMRRQYGLMETGLGRFRKGDTNGGAQAVLVTFQKILDPMSVVRESEYARTAAGQALMSRIQGYAERLAKGGAGLTDAEMSAMVETSRQLLQGVEQGMAGERERISSLAASFGIDPNLIIGKEDEYAPPANAQSPPPTPADSAAEKLRRRRAGQQP